MVSPEARDNTVATVFIIFCFFTTTPSRQRVPLHLPERPQVVASDWKLPSAPIKIAGDTVSTTDRAKSEPHVRHTVFYRIVCDTYYCKQILLLFLNRLYDDDTHAEFVDHFLFFYTHSDPLIAYLKYFFCFFSCDLTQKIIIIRIVHFVLKSSIVMINNIIFRLRTYCVKRLNAVLIT